ncbi:hypothetical protein TTHERM_00334490 (macronuclear) [Tetrahymena thermophila SB210]|uniref:Uncharacterized protein n=1 Tax=Tetrahymena thermophila (strain SB210) TaxID=312017 RepID=I7M868_TETTS|nr:hypothetical protein TTHERM_00334490 [Tetrahymena thermophila SB210]EAR97272.1 hypothetical protein TTHERM_00334490 [Tetrahymena thermophila SB210]|eukprot:XP_001017517.1 hypothetical protein TTHERM_00334490 [Tetrahymena thermophila SB210]
MSYIPITLNVGQLTQQQVQQMDGINLIQPNTYRNISIPRRRQSQYSMNEEHRKSLDTSLYQYRNPIPPQQLQYHQQQPIQPQKQVQMYQIQQNDQKYDPYLKSKPYYTSIQQQIQEKNQIYLQSQNGNSNTNNYPLSYASYPNQIEQIPLQYSQQQLNPTNQQPQYGASLLKYNIVSSSNGKYSENEKQQIAKIAAKYRELKQINTNLMKKRNSIDGSSYPQSDPQFQLNNSYQINNKIITPSNNSFINQTQNSTDLSLLYNQTPTVSQRSYAIQRLSVPVNTKELETVQNYQERLSNGIILGNNTIEQNNISLNTSLNNDAFLQKPRSYSLSIKGDQNLLYPTKLNYDKVQSPVYKQPLQSYVQHQMKQYGQSNANPSQNTNNSINTSLNINNVQSQTPHQNIRVLKTNINHHNLHTQQHKGIIKNDQDKKFQNQNDNQIDHDQYQSNTMKKNVNSYKRQENEGNPVFKAIINAHQARRQILSNSIHIQSVEVLNSAEKQNQNKENENIDRGGENNYHNNQKPQNVDQQTKHIEEKENIAVKQVNTFSNNSSVVIEYNEVYKQDRIPISHAKMTQSKIICDNHNSSIQSKLNQALAKEINVMKQSETLKQVPVQNLEDVKKFVDEQVKQIQIQCQAKYKQKQILNDEDKTSKSAYFIKENSVPQSNNQKGESLIKAFNANKINQNVDTSLNCSDLLQLSLSGLVTPITNNYQSNQQTDQKDAIQIFNNYQPSDRSLNEQKENSQRLQEQHKQTQKEEQDFQKIDLKQSEYVPQSSRSNNQLPTPPSDPNTKTSFYHKKNICKIAETFTFNTNLSSVQTQGSIDYNNIHNSQNQEFTKQNQINNPVISRSPIEQIRKNQQQILKVNENNSSYLSQNDINNKNQIIKNFNDQEKVDQIADLEISHQKLISLHSQYLSQNSSKLIQNFQNEETKNGNDAEINNTQQQILNNDQIDCKNTKNSIETDMNFKNDKNICHQQIEEIQNNQQDSPNNIQNDQSISQQGSMIDNNVSQLEIKQKEIETNYQFPQIEEKIIEEFADSLYYQLNIERSLLQLKSGLSRKITELDHILPLYEYGANSQNDTGYQRGECIEGYRNRLNKILGTNYSSFDLRMIFQVTDEVDNLQEDSSPIIRKEDILEVLLGTQNLTVTSKSQEISEETKKIIRNIIKETLRAQISFKEIKQKYKEFQYELFLQISNGNKEIVTYSDFKAFLIKNGYQVRDQEMMLLIYRFHQPNTIRLTISQFQFKN